MADTGAPPVIPSQFQQYKYVIFAHHLAQLLKLCMKFLCRRSTMATQVFDNLALILGFLLLSIASSPRTVG